MFSAVGISSSEPGDIQVQVLMVEPVEQLLLDQILQYVDIDHITGVGVDRPLDGHIHLVVMPVVIGVAADTEDLLIPVVGARRIIETVRRIEMDAPGDGCQRHRSFQPKSGGRCP